MEHLGTINDEPFPPAIHNTPTDQFGVAFVCTFNPYSQPACPKVLFNAAT